MKASFTGAAYQEIIKPVLPKEWLQDTKYLINPTGRFVIGGPQGLRPHGPQDHRRHLRRRLPGHGGGAFLGQGPVEGQNTPAAYAARQAWPRTSWRNGFGAPVPDPRCAYADRRGR